jgi:hypothetical protein
MRLRSKTVGKGLGTLTSMIEDAASQITENMPTVNGKC